MRKEKLSLLLRTIRAEAKLTQGQLAQIIGQSQSYVSKYESGEQRLDLLELEIVCESLNVPLADFVGRYLEG